jgi:hypothetical protein
MCIIFGDEWLREVTDAVHNELEIHTISGSSIHERMTVVNLALHNLAGIDDNSRETLEYIKQEDAMTFQIAIGTAGKTFKELSAKRNSIRIYG